MIRVSDLKLTMLCRVLPLLALMVMSGLQPSKTMADSLADAGSCRADVVFGIGVSFGKTNFGVQMPPGKVIIHSTNDENDINNDMKSHHAVVGDAQLM